MNCMADVANEEEGDQLPGRLTLLGREEPPEKKKWQLENRIWVGGLKGVETVGIKKNSQRRT